MVVLAGPVGRRVAAASISPRRITSTPSSLPCPYPSLLSSPLPSLPALLPPCREDLGAGAPVRNYSLRSGRRLLKTAAWADLVNTAGNNEKTVDDVIERCFTPRTQTKLELTMKTDVCVPHLPITLLTKQLNFVTQLAVHCLCLCPVICHFPPTAALCSISSHR